MKKAFLMRIISLVLLCTSVIMLVACGSTNSAATTTPAPAEANQATDTAQSAKPEKEKEIHHITISLAQADSSNVVEAANLFCTLLEEKTNGRYTAEVFPNSALAGGNQNTAIEMAQKGSIDITGAGNLALISFIPKMTPISFPWLWKDTETIDKTLVVSSEAGQYFDRVMQENNLKLLGFFENGFRAITNSVRPIHTPDDIKGMKIRIPGNQLLLDVYNALGANPTDFNFNELYTGLQQGTVDGQENPISSTIIPNKFYEVQPYLTDWNYVYEPIAMGMNLDLWNTISAQDQQIILETMQEAVQSQKQVNRDSLDADKQFLRDYGIDVVELTDEETAAFREMIQPAIEKHKALYDKEIIDILYDANA